MSRATSVGSAQRPRPGDGGEVGQPELDRRRSGPRTRPRAAARRSAPDSRSSSRRITLRVVDVAGEGLLGADALLRDVRHHLALVPAPGQGSQVRRRARRRARAAAWPAGCARCRHGAQAEPGQQLPGPLPHAPQRRDRQRVQEAERPRRPERRAARPACSGPRRSWPRTWSVATPTEQVMPCCSATWSRICAPIAAGGPSRRSAPETSRNASSRASGSTCGRDRAEDRHHLRGHGGVRVVAGAGRTPPAGTAAGPAPSASPSARRTPGPRRTPTAPRRGRRAADDDRPAAQLGPLPDLHARVERVHVDVQDVAAGVVRIRAAATAGHAAVSTASAMAEHVQLGGDVPQNGGWRPRRPPPARRSASAAPGRHRAGRPAPGRLKIRTPVHLARPQPGRLDQRGQLRQGEPARHRPRGPGRPPSSASSRPRVASSNRPARARCSTAATALAASTLTAPPGRSTRGDRGHRGGRRVDVLEHAVAEHEVGAASAPATVSRPVGAHPARRAAARPPRRPAAARPRARPGSGRPR